MVNKRVTMWVYPEYPFRHYRRGDNMQIGIGGVLQPVTVTNAELDWRGRIEVEMDKADPEKYVCFDHIPQPPKFRLKDCPGEQLFVREAFDLLVEEIMTEFTEALETVFADRGCPLSARQKYVLKGLVGNE